MPLSRTTKYRSGVPASWKSGIAKPKELGRQMWNDILGSHISLWGFFSCEYSLGEARRGEDVGLQRSASCDAVSQQAGSWAEQLVILSQLMARTHQNVAVVALANKLLGMAWAVLCRNETYRIPALATAPLSQHPVKGSLPGLLADY